MQIIRYFHVSADYDSKVFCVAVDFVEIRV